jgi:hypothetical protein
MDEFIDKLLALALFVLDLSLAVLEMVHGCTEVGFNLELLDNHAQRLRHL